MPTLTVTNRYIAFETALSSVINTILGIVAMMLVFGLHPAATLWGVHGVAVNLIPSVFMMTLMDVIVPTLLTRLRIRRGHLVVRPARRSRWMPHSVTLRAAFSAIGLTVILLPPTLAILYWWGPVTYNLWLLFASQAALGVLVALIIIPVAVRATFNERWSSAIP